MPLTGNVLLTVSPVWIKDWGADCDNTGRLMSAEEKAKRDGAFGKIAIVKVEIASKALIIARGRVSIMKTREGLVVREDMDFQLHDNVRNWVTKAALNCIHGVESKEWFG